MNLALKDSRDQDCSNRSSLNDILPPFFIPNYWLPCLRMFEYIIYVYVVLIFLIFCQLNVCIIENKEKFNLLFMCYWCIEINMHCLCLGQLNKRLFKQTFSYINKELSIFRKKDLRIVFLHLQRTSIQNSNYKINKFCKLSYINFFFKTRMNIFQYLLHI